MSDRALAERLVRTAGAIALELAGSRAAVKGEATDVVTEADTRAEAALLAILRHERPGDAVTGEEGAAVEGGERRWLLDPVDGTLNYAQGIPAWCAATALVGPAGPLACAVFDPIHGELFSAERGAGATVNGTRLAVAPGPPLAAATVATFVDVRRRDASVQAATDALVRGAGALRAIGSGSLELAWLAAGRLHGWLQADSEPWDWEPGALLVAEAGGGAEIRGRWHAAAADAGLLEELHSLTA